MCCSGVYMEQDIIISIKNLSKAYKLYNSPKDRLKEALFPFLKPRDTDYYALNNVSLNIKKGETIGIIGKNGSGKSTLLKIITGVLTPTSGEVKVNGKIAALLELGAGFNPEMTGIENVYMNGIIMGYTEEEMDKRIDKIIEFADIGEYVYQPIKMYSSGMFARLAFAVAINVEPDILIVDEALSVGDMAFQLKCYKKFNDFKVNGKTILFVSHDLNSIMKFCDRAVLMSNGSIISTGNTKNVIDDFKKVISKIDEDDIHIVDNKDELSNTNWKENVYVNPNYSEYGNKKISIIDYGIFNNNDEQINIINNEELVKIRMKIQINNKVNNPIFAFTIRDFHGSDICGTNTLYEDIDTSSYLEDFGILEIEFKQRLALKPGKYTISFGTTAFTDEKLEVFHRLYDVCIIEVNSFKNFVGIYDINSHISIARVV